MRSVSAPVVRPPLQVDAAAVMAAAVCQLSLRVTVPSDARTSHRRPASVARVTVVVRPKALLLEGPPLEAALVGPVRRARRMQ